jgi:hypothetical protein
MPDPRVLGLFRIAFGVLCIVDILRRVPYIALMYSDVGVLPNAAILEAPFATHTFSLLLALGKPGEVAAFFGVGLIAAVMFTVGYRTKLFHIVLALAILSIHNKNVLIENGGDQVANIYVMWTLFLPLGRAYSVDSLLRRMRRVKEQTPAHLNDRGLAPPETEPHWALAYFACLVQLSVIYLFNAVSKNGFTWKEGSAIHYMLQEDRQITLIGYWIRDYVPFWLSKLTSWGTLVLEGLLPLLILSPLFVKWTRRAAFIGVLGLHVGIALIANVGLFSFTMMSAGVLLLTSHDVDALRRLGRRFAGGPLLVFYDSDCGFCHLCARLAKRLDAFGLLEWAGHDWTGPKPPGLDQLREQTLVAWDRERGVVHTRHLAVAAIVRALPLGFAVAWKLRAPGLSGLFGALYDRLAARRTAVSASMGLPACGLTKPGPTPLVSLPSELPAERRWRLVRTGARELVVLFIVAAATVQTIHTNDSTKKLFGKLPLPDSVTRPMSAYVNYTRNYQRWNMFASNVPQSEGWIVIDAELADGRRFDPQTGNEPQFGPVDFAAGVDFGQPWRIYTKRIALKKYDKFRPHLQSWLRNRHKIHGLPPDQRLVAFDVWWIRDDSPKPGQSGVDASREKSRFKVASFHPDRAVTPTAKRLAE